MDHTPPVGWFLLYIPPPQRGEFERCGKMGRLDRVMHHCDLQKLGDQYQGDGTARPSWDQRAVGSRPEQFAARNNIEKYTAHEVMNSLRGLSVVVWDISQTLPEGDERTDLLYVADRISMLVGVLEERVRTRNHDDYNDKHQKSSRRGSRGGS